MVPGKILRLLKYRSNSRNVLSRPSLRASRSETTAQPWIAWTQIARSPIGLTSNLPRVELKNHPWRLKEMRALSPRTWKCHRLHMTYFRMKKMMTLRLWPSPRCPSESVSAKCSPRFTNLRWSLPIHTSKKPNAKSMWRLSCSWESSPLLRSS